MIPPTTDAWEIAWLMVGGAGLLAVLWLMPVTVQELRNAHRTGDAIDRLLSWMNLALGVNSLVKLSVCLAIGVYAAGQPPSTGELSMSGILTRAGLITVEILIAAPPLALLVVRRQLKHIDQQQRNARAARIREESGYGGPERRRAP